MNEIIKEVVGKMKKDNEGFEAWMVLELFGHKKLAGLVTEEERFGAVMLRIDIPTALDIENRRRIYVTQYYHANAIYSATPINEADAIQLADTLRPAPFDKFDLHKESTRNIDGFLRDKCPECGNIIDKCPSCGIFINDIPY